LDLETAQRLSQLTSEFYASVNLSFSQTRQAPWSGWERVTELSGLRELRSPRVLDLACGNLRFEHFLEQVLDATEPQFFAFDSCDELVGETPLVCKSHYLHIDIAEALFAGDDLAATLGVLDCDLSVCFGFMHHLALPQHRADVLDALVSCTAPGGTVAVSFWQLSHSEKLLAKAQRTTRDRAPELGLSGLGEGDYLLGWQGSTDVLRYCHDFSEAEIDDLVRSVGSRASEIARFSSDGASGDLNRYLVLRVEPAGFPRLT